MPERRDDGLFVFVPALMGFGLLASGALLLVDAVRRLVPHSGLRRGHRIARGAGGAVASVAQAAGLQVRGAVPMRREPRARWIYLAVSTTAAIIGAIVIRTGIVAYTDPVGLLHKNPWAIGIPIAIAGPLFIAASLTLLPGIMRERPPRPVRALVQATWLGRPTPPPTDPNELVGEVVEPRRKP